MLQGRLFPYDNPLVLKKSREFFRSVPKRPGVYFFLGVEDSVLYVGKAKSLRDRLNSYRHAKPGQVSRKVIRLLHAMQELRWEECESETAALLRENELLRTLRPPFNVQNTRPDTYYFVALRKLGGAANGRGAGKGGPGQVRLRLTIDPRKHGDSLFGAFKGRSAVRRGYSALLRLLWAAYDPRARQERFEFPLRLVRPSPAHLYTADFPESQMTRLRRFLSGRDPELLKSLTASLLENPAIPPFQYRMIQDDLEELGQFFERTLARNRRLRLRHGIRGRIIPQEKIDDLLVLETEKD